MKEIYPVAQSVRAAIAAQRVEGNNCHNVTLTPSDWDQMLVELTARVGPHWTVLNDGTHRVIEIAAAGLRVSVRCSPEVEKETMELEP